MSLPTNPRPAGVADQLEASDLEGCGSDEEVLRERYADECPLLRQGALFDVARPALTQRDQLLDEWSLGRRNAQGE
jgi:hypothetical protein